MNAIKATVRAESDWRPEVDRPSPVEDDQVARIAGGSVPAFALIRLDDLTIGAITETGFELVNRPLHRVIGRPIADLVDQRDRGSVLTAFAALRQGSIDSFRAHGLGAPSGNQRTAFVAWVRPVELGGIRYALTMWLSPPEARRWRPGLTSLTERMVAVAIADRVGTIKAAFVDSNESAGLVDEDLINLSLLRGAEPQAGQDFPVSIATRGGGRIELRAIVLPLAGSLDRLVGLMALPSPTPREVKLESHLWRIAAEVESSGILIRAGSVPRLALAHSADGPDLTPRQWEVLRRLMAGQRVPTIAGELFVSQSTVRNHLAAIFTRFGVHSQPQLIARVTRLSTPPSDTDGTSIA